MDARIAKKTAEAQRLQGTPPERTLQIGFDLMRFSRDVSRAADRASL